MRLQFPEKGDYNDYYQGYLDLVDADADQDVRTSLQANRDELLGLFAGIEQGQMSFRYREGAWSLSQMLQHIIDTERIFTYRGLCIARGETGALPGYDHEAYAEQAPASHLSREQLIYDFVLARNGMIAMFNSLSEDMLARVGQANGAGLKVAAIPFIMLGHVRHHINIIKTRYLRHE